MLLLLVGTRCLLLPAVWQKLAITGFSHQSHYSTVNYVVVAVAAVAVAG